MTFKGRPTKRKGLIHYNLVKKVKMFEIGLKLLMYREKEALIPVVMIRFKSDQSVHLTEIRDGNR